MGLRVTEQIAYQNAQYGISANVITARPDE